jgi:DNA-binding response OmpR family regulator
MEELPEPYLDERGVRARRGSRRLFVGGEERMLTKKQFEMLVVLTSPPGRAFSYDDLYQSVALAHAARPQQDPLHRVAHGAPAAEHRTGAIDSLHGFGFRFRVEAP